VPARGRSRGADQLRVARGDALTRQIQGGLDLLPGRSVRRGGAWSVRIPHPLPLVGDLTTELECRLDRVDRAGRAFISVSGRMVQPRDTDSASALLELKRSNVEGTMTFDTKAGVLIEQGIKTVSEWSADTGLAESLGGADSVQTIRQSATLTRIE
jgi:hypothetical protein